MTAELSTVGHAPSRRGLLSALGTATAGIAAGTLLDVRPASASPGSPPMYFNNFAYAPSAAEGTADLVNVFRDKFTHTAGFYDIRTGPNWVGLRTANSQAFVTFVGTPFANTWAVVAAAGDDASTTLSQMVYVIKHTTWL